jgi:AraC-like DNA-binding protein
MLAKQIDAEDISARVEQAIKYVRSEYRDPALDLCRTAAVVHLSTFYMSRLIKKATGVGFAAHLRAIRVGHARELLQSTLLSVKEVAALVGYANTNALDRNFKAVLGMTPVVFRHIAGIRLPGDATFERPLDIPAHKWITLERGARGSARHDHVAAVQVGDSRRSRARRTGV